MTNENKLKVIANQYHANKTDDCSREEVYARMTDFLEKKWLSQGFIDGAYDAIMTGKIVRFSYDPEKNMHGYLAGTAEAWEKYDKTTSFSIDRRPDQYIASLASEDE